MNFVPLHVYSGYSFLKSGLSLEKLLDGLKKKSFQGAGLSDYQTLSGIPNFVKMLEKEHLKPIVGMDVSINDDIFSLYILGEIGYRNLLAIDLEVSKGKATLDYIKDHIEGIVMIYSMKNQGLKRLYDISPKEIPQFLSSISKRIKDFYIGIQIDNKDDENYANYIREFAKSHSYETIAFPFVKYERKEDAIVLKIVEAIDKEDELKEKEQSGPNYLLTQKAIETLYKKEEIDNTIKILNSTTFKFSLVRGKLLKFSNDKGLSSDEYLRNICFASLKEKIPQMDETYVTRLNYELDVIAKMGYSDYFLIVMDYVNFCKTKNIYVGPGRGSAAGSLVSYALNIVKADPLKYNLIFERFLNIERQSMPDIDCDFEDTRREEVISYLISKYGGERVAHILTVQTIGAKQALRDIGRVYNISTREIDLISKLITDQKATLKETYKTNLAFKKLVDSDKYYLEIVSLASKIEGLPRQSGLHAAGVILNDETLEKSLPISVDFLGNYICQYEMDYLEEQGFLKMDVLGLRNLSIIHNCLNEISSNHHININYDDIPWEDEKAIELIKSGKTMGLFQLESAGMKKTVEQVRPESFEDIIAIISLFRPGPMVNIPSFTRRKHGLEKINYISSAVEEILKPTYGIIVYQEQIMQIVRKMANFSYGKADLFRRAISKKDSVKLIALKEEFVSESQKNGYKKLEAEEVFALIYRFADYGFNRNHALSYAILACQMAYLKTYYGPEFYASILDNTSGSNDVKFNETISEMKSLNIKIKLPNINKSKNRYYVKDNALMFPLESIKGILHASVINIIEERENHGLFNDFFDFVTRMFSYKLPVQQIDKLIDSGCFDEMESSRETLRTSLPSALQYASMMYTKDGQMRIIDFVPKPSLIKGIDDPLDNLYKEYECLGIMLSGSPLSYYLIDKDKYNLTPIVDIAKLNKTNDINIFGIIKSVKVINTKKGSPMAFVSIADDTYELEATIFSDTYADCFTYLKKNSIVLINGYIDTHHNNNFIVKNIGPVQ